MYHARPLPPHPTSTGGLGLYYTLLSRPCPPRPAPPHALLRPHPHPHLLYTLPSSWSRTSCHARAHPASTSLPTLRRLHPPKQLPSVWSSLRVGLEREKGEGWARDVRARWGLSCSHERGWADIGLKGDDRGRQRCLMRWEKIG
jgi:hypothetical protein